MSVPWLLPAASRPRCTSAVPRADTYPLSSGGGAVGGGEREFCAQAGASFGGAVEEESAADRIDAVLQADQAGVAGEVGAASAVIVPSGRNSRVTRVRSLWCTTSARTGGSPPGSTWPGAISPSRAKRPSPSVIASL